MEAFTVFQGDRRKRDKVRTYTSSAQKSISTYSFRLLTQIEQFLKQLYIKLQN